MDKQGGKPPITEETVAWATSPEMLKYADPKKMDEVDRHIVSGDRLAGKLRGRKLGTTGPSIESGKPTTRGSSTLRRTRSKRKNGWRNWSRAPMLSNSDRSADSPPRPPRSSSASS